MHSSVADTCDLHRITAPRSRCSWIHRTSTRFRGELIHDSSCGMFPYAREVRLSPGERSELEARVRAPTTEQRQAFRARIVLMAAEGRSTRSIARDLGTTPRTVSLWRIRFAEAESERVSGPPPALGGAA